MGSLRVSGQRSAVSLQLSAVSLQLSAFSRQPWHRLWPLATLCERPWDFTQIKAMLTGFIQMLITES
ncbi:MAG: hypothetical protein F6K26_13970 [Moorea sp. SIO2I5]|nr:hypothetical protein [Moorena sp. SIO2I5]